MKRIFRALIPRTLSSQLVIVAALSLLIAQVISFSLLMREQHEQWVTVSTAPVVMRIVDALEDGPPRNATDWHGGGHDGDHGNSWDRDGRSDDHEHGEGRNDWQNNRVAISATMPLLIGREEPALATRASDLLANSGVKTRQVVARIDDRPPPPSRLEKLAARGIRRPPNMERVRIAAQLDDGRWVVATGRARKGPPMVTRFLIGQTILIYAAVLLPLLWMGRRLSAPLGTLTTAARDFEPGATVPLRLTECGPEDIRDLTRAFNDMHGRIAAMLAEKDHMLGAIGHDLRTPLAALRVRVESVDDAEERGQMVGTIEEMRQMLDDILALARIGRDRQPPQRLDLGMLAEAVVDDFNAIGADVTLADTSRTVVSVRAPALRRAIRNLVDNAVNYGERARLSIHVESATARLRVEDDGPGIDPARISDMLEPFTRLEESRNRETGGTGLGLALVRAVMRAEGGDVHLANRADGKGLVAELILPLAEG